MQQRQPYPLHAHPKAAQPTNRPTPAQPAPVAPRPVQQANTVTAPAPIQAGPATPSFPIEDDDNFKFYRAKLWQAKSLKELSDLGPVIAKQVVDGQVVKALREEYRKAESALTEKANAKIESFVGAGK
jgi:hypothetical protein